MAIIDLLQSTRVAKPIFGILIPMLVFAFSFIVTWILYKHFSKHLK